ncbi:MAG TPA: serine protease [Bacteriovoracaceae bacterium]|nr:serine protease [Bacteriovoracaceae bacterium]
MKLHLCLMLLSLGLAACGEKKVHREMDLIYLNSGETLNSYSRTLTLDPKTPDGVGTLLSLNEGIYGKSNVGICTWFLVGPNRAVTNSHCVPDSVKKSPAHYCGDYLQGSFKTPEGENKIRCKKLLFASDISKPTLLNNDYALIELEDNIPGAHSFKLDRRGISEGQKLKILTMNHQQLDSGVYSEFKEQNCIMKSSDIMGRITSLGTSPVTGFKEENTLELCKTIGGNSGSPVVDEAGRLIGILHGGMKEGFDLGQEIKIDSNQITSHISIITNLRCQKFQDPQLDQAYPSTCGSEKRENGADKEKILKTLQPKMLKAMEVVQATQPSYLDYTVTTKELGSNTLIHYLPKCIKPLDTWTQESLNQVRESGFMSKKKSIQATIPQHRMEFSVSLDYYGNFSMEPSMKGSGSILLTIEGLEDLKKKGYAISKADLSSIGIKEGLETKLPVCMTKAVE